MALSNHDSTTVGLKVRLGAELQSFLPSSGRLGLGSLTNLLYLAAKRRQVLSYQDHQSSRLIRGGLFHFDPEVFGPQPA